MDPSVRVPVVVPLARVPGVSPLPRGRSLTLIGIMALALVVGIVLWRAIFGERGERGESQQPPSEGDITREWDEAMAQARRDRIADEAKLRGHAR